jgi:hypothetical protein
MIAPEQEPQVSNDSLVDLEKNQDALSAAIARKDLADKLDEFGAKWESNKSVLVNLEAIAAHGRSLADVRSGGLTDAREALLKIAEFGGDMEKASSRDSLVRLIGDFEDWLRGPNGRITRSVKQAYDDLVRMEFEPLEAAGSVLVRIEATSGLGSRLKAFVARARNFASRPAPELLASIAETRAEAASLKGEYEALSHVEGAKEFLDALIDGRATLAHVTPAVLAWLDKLDGAREGFKIMSA